MKQTFKLLALFAFSSLALEPLMARQVYTKGDKVCVDAVYAFAQLHRIEPKYYIMPCVKAPCPFQGIQVAINNRELFDLKANLLSSNNTKSCVRQLRTIPYR